MGMIRYRKASEKGERRVGRGRWTLKVRRKCFMERGERVGRAMRIDTTTQSLSGREDKRDPHDGGVGRKRGARRTLPSRRSESE